jgi:hypothetical protein
VEIRCAFQSTVITDSVLIMITILSRFHARTVRGSNGPPSFSLDHLPTNVMLYWICGINAPN